MPEIYECNISLIIANVEDEENKITTESERTEEIHSRNASILKDKENEKLDSAVTKHPSYI